MAVEHIGFNRGTDYGAEYRSFLVDLQNVLVKGNKIGESMAAMIDGAVDQAASYTYFADKYGNPSTTAAMAMRDQHTSLMFFLNATGPVEGVNQAIVSALNKML